MPEDQITNAVSLNTAVMTGSRIFGPALAALLIGTVGTAVLFTINAVSFVAILGRSMLIDRTRLFAPPGQGRNTCVATACAMSARPDHAGDVLVFVIVSTFGYNYNDLAPTHVGRDLGQ